MGCAALNYDKRPNSGTKWVSSEPDIWFVMDKGVGIGKITIDGVTIDIHVVFDFSIDIHFKEPLTSENQLNYYEYYYFKGSCKFGEHKIVVAVTNNSKGFLDDSIKKITFVREEIEISH